MYVDDHGLDFKYYKDYGWDPVSLQNMRQKWRIRQSDEQK